MDKNKNKLTNFIRSLFKDWNGHYDLRDSTGKPLLSILNANHSNCIDRIIVLDKERIAASYFIARLFEQKTRLLTEEITAPDDTTYNILNVQGAVDYLTNEDFKNLRRHTKGSLLLNSIKVLEKHKKTKTDNNLLYKLIIVSQKYATELFSEDDNMQIIVKKLALLKDHINENTQVLIEILNQTEKSPIKSPIKSILCLFWSTLVTFIEKIQSKKDKEYSQKAL